MKSVVSFSKMIGCAVALAALWAASTAEAAVGKAVVRAVRGSNASYSEKGGEWKPLNVGRVLGPGNSVRTGQSTQIDLFLEDNGPVVRLLENTTLALDRLDFDRTGAETVIETQLNLTRGTIQGVVKRLAAASKYEVKTPNAVTGIRGTEYEITAENMVHCIEGSLLVAYTNPSTGRISAHTVNQGFTFVPPANPAAPGAEPTVRPTRPGETHPPIGGVIERDGVAPLAEAPQTLVFVSPVSGGEAAVAEPRGE